MKETWIQSLGQEDPLKKEMATHSSMLAWKIPWTEEPWWAAVHGVAELGTTEQLTPPVDKTPHFQCLHCRGHGFDPWLGN